jgi:hypothetical protein
MSNDTLYPPPPETDMEGNDSLLPLQIQHKFDTMYSIIKEKRRMNHSQSPTELIEDCASTKRSRERLDDPIVEEKKDDKEEEGGHLSSNMDCCNSNRKEKENELRYIEAAVAAAVLMDQEIKRWERGVAELESLFAQGCQEAEGTVVHVPFPFLVPVVENASSESVVEATP